MYKRALSDKLLLDISKFHKQNTVIEIQKFCIENNLNYTKQQQRKALDVLIDLKYIDARKNKMGKYFIKGITGLGEANLSYLKQYKNNENPSYKSKVLYVSKKCTFDIKDKNVVPCFSIQGLVNSYLLLIDSGNEINSTDQFYGIFAPWGRGKTYFFNELEKLVISRNKDIQMNKLDLTKYDIVKFNAWKYQETPSIWAYLFETIFQSRSWIFRSSYCLIRNLKSLLCDILLYSLPILIFCVLSMCFGLKIWLIIPGIGVGLGSIIRFFVKIKPIDYNKAISLIKKYSKGVSFTKEMGIQAEIEKELEKLLRTWIPLKKENTESTAWFTKLGHWFYNYLYLKFRIRQKKVILYIDDIDRCDEEKMMSIIESLRTVLENDAIRKRLVVVCSIDPKKLYVGLKNKYKNLYTGKSLMNIVSEQMDKIFLSGICLPNINQHAYDEYIDILSGEMNMENDVMLNSTVYDTSIKNYSFVSSQTKFVTCNNKTLGKLFKEILASMQFDNSVHFTPRKIRIIYYRILLCNNLISTSNTDEILGVDVIKEIIILSVGMSRTYKIDDRYYDIIQMVVPYSCADLNCEDEEKKIVKNSKEQESVDTAE